MHGVSVPQAQDRPKLSISIDLKIQRLAWPHRNLDVAWADRELVEIFAI